MLAVGIVGLPNVGKSTLFNALTRQQANVSNYPFTTIDSNIGVVPVPDQRLATLAKILEPEETTPGFIRFIDIAGLVRGASKGEGLGNQFLANIRGVDAIVHVVRCFQDPEVSHVLGDVDPARDIDIVETELLLADLEVIDRAIEKRKKIWKTSPRQFASEEKKYTGYREKLASGIPLRTLDLNWEDLQDLKGLGMLTSKPVLFAANLMEGEISDSDHACVQRIRQSRISVDPQVIPVSAKFESELLQLEEEERMEFLNDLGLSSSGLDRLIEAAYRLLGLITFYTVANNRLRAWEIKEGTPAPQAAGKIHTDMERGFIKAQVVRYELLKEQRGWQTLHKTGLLRTEGKEYVVQDGDVIEFLFSK